MKAKLFQSNRLQEIKTVIVKNHNNKNHLPDNC